MEHASELALPTLGHTWFTHSGIEGFLADMISLLFPVESRGLRRGG